MKEITAALANGFRPPNTLLKDLPFDIADLEHTDELLEQCSAEIRAKIEAYLGDSLGSGWYLLGCHPGKSIVLVGDGDVLGFSPHRAEHARLKIIRVSIWPNGSFDQQYFLSQYDEMAKGIKWMRATSPHPRKNKGVHIPTGYSGYWLEEPNGDVMGSTAHAITPNKLGYCRIGTEPLPYASTRCWIRHGEGVMVLSIPNRIQFSMVDVVKIGRDILDLLNDKRRPQAMPTSTETPITLHSADLARLRSTIFYASSGDFNADRAPEGYLIVSEALQSLKAAGTAVDEGRLYWWEQAGGINTGQSESSGDTICN